MLSSSVKADALKVIQPDGLWTIKKPTKQTKQNKQIFHNNDLTELAKAPADTAQNEPWGMGGTKGPTWHNLYCQQAQSTHLWIRYCLHLVTGQWFTAVHRRTLSLVWTDEHRLDYLTTD